MLPDFPKIKRKWSDVAVGYIKNQTGRDSVLSLIKKERHFEGNRMLSRDDAGYQEESGYQLISGKLEVSTKDIIEKGPKAVMEQLQKLADDLKKQQAKLFYDRMDEITSQTGNKVNAKGKPFSPDLFLKMLENLEMEFDDHGNPIMPTIVVSPEQAEKLKEKIPEWEADMEHKKRFDDLIKKKRKEWNDRESNRKLVD